MVFQFALVGLWLASWLRVAATSFDEAHPWRLFSFCRLVLPQDDMFTYPLTRLGLFYWKCDTSFLNECVIPLSTCELTVEPALENFLVAILLLVPTILTCVLVHTGLRALCSQTFRSSVIEYCFHYPSVLKNASTTRGIFGSYVFTKPFPTKRSHSHPLCAAIRTASAADAQSFAGQIGRRPFFLQRSVADERNGRVGSRTYYWAKDVAAEHCDHLPAKEDLAVIVDTDMYMDMPHLLATDPRTYFLSTFQPTVVAHSGPEYDFTFDDKDCVHYRVSGGAVYRHPVWNYGSDVFIARTFS